jgi:putative acetyltransferase
MTVKVHIGDPKSAAGTALLTASRAYMEARYPAEHMFALSIDALCAPSITFLIATVDGTALGCVALKAHDGYGEVKSMFVAEAARGAGVGAALMNALQAQAQTLALPVLKLETGDDLDSAHRLYQRHGFAFCGPFGDYVEGPHSLFMEKRL